jgi:hypothetical protein
MPTQSRPSVAFRYLALILCAIPALCFADTNSDQVQYTQKTVQAQMQELQDRMFRLADLTRDAEPDDSARLLMALRKAREQLILEQMHDILDELSHSDLARASDEQSQVLVKLEELKKLLTSTDLDMQMRLEQLRTLSAAIAKLDVAIKEEKRQRDQTGAYSQQQAQGKLDLKLLTGSQQDQRQNRKATETVAATVKDLGPGPAKASDTLGNACQSMSLAEGAFGGNRSSDARGLQSNAVDAMQRARDQLESERQKILDQLQSQVRKQVIQSLQEMLNRQKNVRNATESIVGRLPSGDPQTLARVARLSPPENAIVRICDDTNDLIKETEFSVALPPALAEIHDSCAAISDRLQSGMANDATIAAEKQVEQDLQDLIDTFKELQSDPGPPCNCRGCKGNKNKLIAELKVLRMLQSRVNKQTIQADASRGVTTQPSDAIITSINSIRGRQSDIQQAAEQIHRELAGY